MREEASSAPRLLIIGSGGMLGRALLAAARGRRFELHALADRRALDITDAAAVRTAIAALRPRIVINAAAYTNVDQAEAEPGLAAAVNTIAVRHLAESCARADALLVHFSTDYVFSGRAETPWTVDAETDPVNAYGRTKRDGEFELQRRGGRSLLIRTSRLFDSHGRNFVRTILDLARTNPVLDVVDDQLSLPTCARDLAKATFDFLERSPSGVFHVANDGACSWHELAQAAVKHAGLNCEVRACRTADMPRPAARPAYSVLDLSRTAALIGPPRHWRDALRECVGRMLARASSAPEPAHARA